MPYQGKQLNLFGLLFALITFQHTQKAEAIT